MPEKESLIKYLLTLAISLAAALSGYFAIYTGLRVELAGKAEERYVTEMNVRLARLESVINERFATREDLSTFKNEVIGKLTAIETVLSKEDKAILKSERNH